MARWAPLLEHFGRLIADQGGGFCPMYGMTEAAARISRFAPDLLFEHLGPGPGLRPEGGGSSARASVPAPQEALSCLPGAI